MSLELRPIKQMLGAGLLVAMTALPALPADEATKASQKLSDSQSSLRGPSQVMTSDELFSKLLEHNRLRDLRLEQYSAVRTYEAKNSSGKLYAQETVVVSYQAPETKTFQTTSGEGSSLVRNLVFKRLRESEAEAAGGQQHRDSSLKPANYALRLVGQQDIGSYHCLVVEALPKRQDKYLFEGKIWIDAQDFAVVRIEGHPAKKLSFWINRADFVRQYQKIGDFWVPCKDETFVEIRLYGKKVLTIDHRDYTINGAKSTSEQAQDFAGDNQVAVR
jgi:hypothetical protein